MAEKDIVEFRTSDDLVTAYQDLLREKDWSLETLHRALQVFYELIRNAKLTVQFPWEEPRKRQRGEYPIPPTASDDVRQWLEMMNDKAAQEASGRENDEKVRWTEEKRLQAKVEFSLIAELVLRRLQRKIEGDIGFFHDLQSLIFQVATLHLLPEVLSKDRGVDLLGALWGYCHVTWQRDATHAEMLRALLAEELGQLDVAEESLRNAIAQTPSNSHDYLTKVQALWSLLVEQHRTKEAIELIFRVHREASAELEAELLELMRQTILLEVREARTGRSRRKN